MIQQGDLHPKHMFEGVHIARRSIYPSFEHQLSLRRQRQPLRAMRGPRREHAQQAPQDLLIETGTLPNH
ncbi:hypothetical protein DA83_21185 [Pseudomonas sp. 250J]|nr:hypothetical protein DA83_21185 [Pseudomonas sp. 250J]